MGFPRTSLLLAGRALLLQVAHPVVGAGVRDFSDFRTRPWARLDHTVASLLTQLFGGAGAIGEAQRLRRMHAGINGTTFDGTAYRALDPAAWAWVHVANGETMLRFHALFGSPLEPDDKERYWQEWRQVGRLLGIDDHELPPDVRALDRYVEEMAATTLGDNETVRVLLDTLALRDVPPPTPLFPAPLWDSLRPAGRFLLGDATVGTLPVALRTTLGLDWGDAQQRRLERTAAVMRTVGEALPERVLHYPAAYRAMRSSRRWRAGAPTAR